MNDTQHAARLPSLQGRRVLVTGATGGVGSGIARSFAEAGAAVAVHYRSNADAAERLVAEIESIGGRAVAVGADLSQPGSAQDLVARSAVELGGLDALVNNAGIQPVEPLSELGRESWDAMFATNVGVVFSLSQAAAQVFEGSGSITHIASVEAHRPAAGHAHYASAKAALLMHARAAALELGPAGIRVNTVSPGLVEVPGLAENWPEGVASWLAHAPLGRMATPRDIGDACVLLASDAAAFITGQDLAVDGGMLATPGW